MPGIASLDPHMAVKDADSGLRWYDAVKLTVEGKGWDDTEKPFQRLPAKAKGLVPGPVWDLSRHSAGMHCQNC